MRKAAVRGRDKLEVLLAEHRAIDDRICELGDQRFLTPAEQIEMKTLKKRRLAKKDLIIQLQERRAG